MIAKTQKTYKNLYFDLDKTLYDIMSNTKQTLIELINRYISELNPVISEFLDFYYQKNEELWLQYRNGELRKEVLRTKRFSDSLIKFGIHDEALAKKLSTAYINESPYKTKLFPNTIETLEYLKAKGYRMFLLSNGFLEVQVIKIRESKLEPFFEKMMTSEEAGYQKPHQKIFEYALKTVNSRKSESIMIGDDIDNDIFGAKRFGMDTIYFNPEKTKQTIQPTFEISDLKELQTIL
ncbi:MAG: YjjG family noncanonical pyrimidine nucleotidase [Salinivirgaceae bacterium]|jgi:putative hydrolase of the HAD superfamily|nr:YjjG family noncanonical pyrimidine nucleotidase [Salinivirgaceae bacterium]